MLRLVREASWIGLWLIFVVAASCLSGRACDEAPAGQTFRIRLTDPVSSYSSKRGTPIRGILLESPTCDEVPLFPLGTLVEGRIKSVQKVGMGLRHEAAKLALEFDWISPEGASSVEMRTRVLEVDNAREKIRDGVIQGVREADAIQGRVLFRWLHFPVWDPTSLWLSAFSQSVFPISPEPEIYLPPGTDLSLELTEPLIVDETIPQPTERSDFDQSEKIALDEMVASYAQRTYNTHGKQADVVNLLLIGTQRQVQDAFRTAGWKNSDAISTKSVLREFHAIFSLNNYPRMPMASHLLDGRLSDWALEKGFDSYAKRDHLRVWSVADQWEGQSIWLSAATGESGASWSLRTGKFVHHVEPDLDAEREKVVNDLTVAGCVSSGYTAPRPAMSHDVVGSSGNSMRTDGSVAIVQLKDCSITYAALPAAEIATRPHSKFARFLRREVLTARNAWRQNIVYDAFDLSRAGVRKLRNHERNQEQGAFSAGVEHPSDTK